MGWAFFMPNFISSYTHHYPPLYYAGGEAYLHQLNLKLKADVYLDWLGKNINHYTYENINVYPSILFEPDNYQVIISHLDRLGNCANLLLKKKQIHKLVAIVHNTNEQAVIAREKLKPIYNSYWLKDYHMNKNRYPDGLVLYPPTLTPPQKQVNPTYVTLVNCNENKGGNLLIELAKSFPDQQFLGVLGAYGKQIQGNLPNLTYIANGANMNDVYQSTKVLIQPSKYESFGKAAVEAMGYSIPVLATPTYGLNESLDYARIEFSHDNLKLLLTDSSYYKDKQQLSIRRYNELLEITEKQLNQVYETLHLY